MDDGSTELRMPRRPLVWGLGEDHGEKAKEIAAGGETARTRSASKRKWGGGLGELAKDRYSWGRLSLMLIL